MDKTLISFGHGYVAQALGQALLADGWQVFGTTRDASRADALANTGVTPLLWSDEGAIRAAMGQASHLLASAAPGPQGDPVLAAFGPAIAAAAPRLRWAGYLSTTGVYGDHQGAWVDEDTPLTPSTARGQARVLAEAEWQALTALPLHIFRLAGIYGPGRGPFAKLRAGTAQRIVKPGQVFSRIHRDDIVRVLRASMAHPNPGRMYNLCDDDPAPPQDVIGHAAQLLGLPMPPEIAFDQADLGPMARSFYAESKRVSNARIKQELGVSLAYPTYRQGLASLLAAGE
ncbi:MAG: SDR family oxidoreductase [Lutimaribacter sp.]|jgi:nucleoside-diphosphate-sugar epimerase